MFKNKYRIRAYDGCYSVDCCRWWWPFWVSIQPRGARPWGNQEVAEIAIVRHAKYKHRHVVKQYDDGELLAITRRLEGKKE